MCSVVAATLLGTALAPEQDTGPVAAGPPAAIHLQVRVGLGRAKSTRARTSRALQYTTCGDRGAPDLGVPVDSARAIHS